MLAPMVTPSHVSMEINLSSAYHHKNNLDNNNINFNENVDINA